MQHCKGLPRREFERDSRLRRGPQRLRDCGKKDFGDMLFHGPMVMYAAWYTVGLLATLRG